MTHDPDLTSEAQERVGAVLRGKYRLDSILGIGGMATVYAATHRNRAALAVKVLHRDLTCDPAIRARFLREANAVNSIRHPGVVRIVDDDVAADGSAFLVMERLEGETAQQLCDRSGGRLPVAAAVSLAEQLLDVLRAAHAVGVIHRDVKPANLFVTTDGDVRVLDFGIARMREALAPSGLLTGGGAILGTPTFMAPEQALPGMTEIDERTDVWAVGATLFALLSGRCVHEAESVGEVLVRAAMNAAVSLAEVMRKAPRAIAEVVDVALAFEKPSRWASASEMREALLAAHRLHFGASPSRRSLARLFEPPASGVVRAPSPHARTQCDFSGAGPPPWAAPPPESSVVAPDDTDSRRRRTSIPIALEAARPEPVRTRRSIFRMVTAVAGATLAAIATLRAHCEAPSAPSLGSPSPAPLPMDTATMKVPALDAAVAEPTTADAPRAP